MVVVPWRRLMAAARWKGHAPQSTTGVASTSETQAQRSNCQGGTIASAITGTASIAETTSRRRSEASSASPAASSWSAAGSGTVAAYPALATVSSSRSVLMPLAKTTCAFSVA